MYHLKTESSDSEDPLYGKIMGGDDIIFVPEAKLAKEYFINGIQDKGYIQWVCENFIKPGTNVIDIGANIGLYTIEIAKICQRVYSFETCPRNYNFLCANILLRELSYKVTTYNTSLSNTTGTIKIYTPENNRDITISKVKLDSLDIKNVSFIKISTNGDEECILRGSIKTIMENSYPPILFSLSPETTSGILYAKHNRESLFKFVESLGYSIIQVRRPADNMFLATKKMFIVKEEPTQEQQVKLTGVHSV
jgi:FkbM family methyltransferase